MVAMTAAPSVTLGACATGQNVHISTCDTFNPAAYNEVEMATVMRLAANESRGAAASPIDWRAVFDAELPRILNYFRYRVDDGMLAEDLAAETFERAWRARARYQRDRAAFSTWLFTIAQRIAIDHFRRNAHRRDTDLDTLAEHGDPTPAPDEQAERNDSTERLRRLVARLPQRERELVALKYGAGLTNREIAKLTALSESNVGTLLSRIVGRLREQLAG